MTYTTKTEYEGFMGLRNWLLFLWRCGKHIGLLWVLCFPLQLIGAITLMPYLLFVQQRFEGNYIIPPKLPFLLRLFDNADFYAGRDVSTYAAVFNSGRWNTYCWLAWRNPLNYFGYFVLGVRCQTIKLLDVYCNAVFKLGEVGDTKHAGFIYCECLINDSVYYEYYWVKPYKLFGKSKCIRFRLGWKLDSPYIGELAEWVCVLQPYHDFTGGA